MTKEELINEVLKLLEFFRFNNSNLTKKQWQKLVDLCDFIDKER